MSTLKIGDKEVDVKEFRNDWALALMSRGIVVDLRISIWRAEAKIDAADLGLQFSDGEAQDFMSKYVRLGSERLLPPAVSREIRAIEKAGRDNLNRHSFDTIWGKFVPYNAFDSWANENAAIKSTFEEYVRLFCNRYNEIVDIVANEYRIMGKDVWRRVHPNDGEAPEPYLTEFTNKVIEKIPLQSQMPLLFKYETVFFTIPLPSIIHSNIATAKNIQLETENKEFAADLERRTKQRIAEEYVSRKTDLIDGFLNATVLSMRKYVEDLCQEVLESLCQARVKDLSLKQQEKIVEMIDKVRMLNFYDDAEIEKLLNELKFESMKVKGERDKDTIISKLQKIVEVAGEEFTPKDFNPTIDYLEL